MKVSSRHDMASVPVNSQQQWIPTLEEAGLNVYMGWGSRVPYMLSSHLLPCSLSLTEKDRINALFRAGQFAALSSIMNSLCEPTFQN